MKYITGIITKLEILTTIHTLGGIGYELMISANSLYQLSLLTIKSEEVQIFTHTHYTETSQDLYGFHNEEELDCFKLLISVNGIGPRTAINILSSMTPTEVAESLESTDGVKAFNSIKGIGPRTAEKVMLLLEGKMTHLLYGMDISEMKNKAMAIKGLIQLGFSKTKVGAAVHQVMKGQTSIIDASAIIKSALKIIK